MILKIYGIFTEDLFDTHGIRGKKILASLTQAPAIEIRIGKDILLKTKRFIFFIYKDNYLLYLYYKIFRASNGDGINVFFNEVFEVEVNEDDFKNSSFDL